MFGTIFYIKIFQENFMRFESVFVNFMEILSLCSTFEGSIACLYIKISFLTKQICY